MVNFGKFCIFAYNSMFFYENIGIDMLLKSLNIPIIPTQNSPPCPLSYPAIEGELDGWASPLSFERGERGVS